MPSRSEEKYLFEFDGFRVDPVRRRLSHHGEPVAITPKAFSILLVLLERAGEVVEKKELLDKVWPGAFVTEANLTQNVFSLRKCLGERANDNRYIITVPGQGYSFAGEVRRIERFSTGEVALPVLEPPPPQPPRPAAAIPQAAPDPAPPVDLPEIPAPPAGSGELPAVAAAAPVPMPVPPEALPGIPPRSTRRSLVVWGVLSVLVVMGAVLFAFLFSSGTKPARSAVRLGSQGRLAIAVLDFKSLSPGNDTRWLQKAFAEMLTTELAAGGKMRVIRGEAVAEALRSLDLKDPRGLGRAELERLHDMLGADLVVVGSYVPIGGKLRLDLRVLDAPEGNTVVSLAEVGTQAGLFEMVSDTGEKLRDSLGVAALSPRQIQETQALRPSSTEASRLYVEGLTRLRAYDPPGALRYLRQAVEADPGSAVIHSALSQAWFDMGYDSQSVEEARKALDLGPSLSREQRLVIEGRLYKAQKNWEKMSQTYRTLATFFPDDLNYGLQLAESLMMGGRGAEAAETLAALRKLPPPMGDDARIDVMEARNANRLGDYETLKRASAIAAAKGRKSGQPLVVSQAVVFQGTALLKMGHPQEAIRLFREGVALADQAGYQWGKGMALSNLAAGLQLVGDLEGAQKASEQSLAIAERVGSAVGITSQLFSLGRLHQDRGRLKEALSLLEQARNWCVKMGDRYMETQVLDSIGEVLLAQGDLAGARRRFVQALDLSQAVHNRAKEGLSQVHLATILAYQGELEQARRRHAEAFALLSRVGDSSTAASALAASADAGARLGDLHAAWQQSARALEAKRQSGDRLGTGRVLGSRAWLAYELGDLAASRALAEEQRRIAEQTGARSLTAWALQNLGRADFAAGNLDAARAAFEESRQVSSALGEELRAMEIRLDLARLALAANRASEATLLSREAASWFRVRGIPGGEIRAQSLLAEALLRQGLPGEARQAVAEARARLAACQDHELRATAAVSLARFEAAAGHPAEALRLLRQAAADADRTGFTAAGLEVRLALGEIQRSLGDTTALATLAEVRKQAEALGFKRLAMRAALRPLPAVNRAPVTG